MTGSIPGHSAPRDNYRSVFHTSVAFVTKQYNLVPVNGRYCPTAGKLTVWRRTGHAPQTSVVYPPADTSTAYMFGGDKHPPTLLYVCSPFYLYIDYDKALVTWNSLPEHLRLPSIISKEQCDLFRRVNNL